MKHLLPYIAVLLGFAALSVINKAYAHDILFLTDNRIIYDACLSEHGDVLFVADGQQVKAFNFADGQTIRVFGNGHKDQIMSLVVSADSALLASGDRSGLLILRNLVTGNVVQSLSHHDGLIMALDISSNSKHMASGATDNKVVVYDLESAEIVQTLEEHKDDVLAVSFSQDGKWLVSAAADGKIVVVDMDKLAVHQIITTHAAFLRDVQFAPDGKSFISVGDDGRYVRHQINDEGIFIEVESLKMSSHWISSFDHTGEEDTYVLADARGRVVMKTRLVTMRANAKAPVNRILIRVTEDKRFAIIAATNGNGIVFFSGADMRVRSN